ncbi:MAG TPA: hypothetical protein VH912_18015 [Streptosporangiaceae bacterium]
MRRRTATMIAAGVIVAGALAATGSTLATASPSPSPRSDKSSASAAPDDKAKGKAPGYDATLAEQARQLGVTPDQLEQALISVKRSLGRTGGKPTDPAVVDQFARELGISTEQARAFIEEITQPSQGTDADLPKLAKILAADLGISDQAATDALRQLAQMGRTGGIKPKSPEFAALARRLGVSPERLATALDTVKRGVAKRPDSGDPSEKKPQKPKE